MTPPTMNMQPRIPRIALSCLGWALLTASTARAEVAPHIVLLNGRAVPLAAVALQGESFVVKTATVDFVAGALIPVGSVDHIFGDKPPEINQAVALTLAGKAPEALKLLEPVLARHHDTAKLPGNFWLEAARTALVAEAVGGSAAACKDLVKAISDATPAQGIDPISRLATALTMSTSIKFTDRLDALRILTADNLPADVCAYASFFRAELHKKHKQDAEALEAYLSVSCLFPSGGMVVNGVSQIKAAEILTAMNRREEALALVNSALRCVKGTAAEEPAKQLLQSIK